MRLKEDRSSWKAGGVKAKLARHKKDDTPVNNKRRKNRAKWCKGKIGIKHDFSLVKRTNYVFGLNEYSWSTFKCTKCGKTKII